MGDLESQKFFDAVDTQQRLRVAAEALRHDLSMAGAGMHAGPASGSLVGSFAPVLPRRIGLQSPDASSVARADAVTITFVPPTVAQAASSMALPTGTAFSLTASSSCPSASAACGFQAGMTALMFDQLGHFADVDRIPSVAELPGWLATRRGSGIA